MAKSNETTAAPPAPDLLPVINRADRLQSLGYSVTREIPGNAKPVTTTERLTLPPGLSFIKRELAERCGFGKGRELDPFDGRGSLRVASPLDVFEAEAVQLAWCTGNRQALRMWLEREERLAVRHAIEGRLRGEKPEQADAAPAPFRMSAGDLEIPSVGATGAVYG